MQHTSHIELSKSALSTNLSFIKSLLGNTKLSCVVKGNAYGHSIEKFCPLLYQNGVRHFSVFSSYEAERVLNCLPKDITIMIMGYIDNIQIEWAITNNIEFFVFEEDKLDKAIEIAKKTKSTAKIHLEIETGMNRTGFELKTFSTILNKIQKHITSVEVKGVCSHLAGAESIANYKRIKDQYKKFTKTQKQLSKLDWINPDYHLACSAASIQYPKTQMDIARIGILQYGFFPSDEVLIQYLTKNKIYDNPLKRVMSWKTKVMDTKTVKQGEFIGYGTSYFTNAKTKIALIPVGYAYGFSRSLSNQGKVLIRGTRFNVIGTVNMNMLAVDITKLDTIEKGEEVVLIGKQGEFQINVSSFSEYSRLLNYELLTRLPADIPRIITA
jgi:alanine racemase